MNMAPEPVTAASPATMPSLPFGMLKLKKASDAIPAETAQERETTEQNVQKVVKELNQYFRTTGTELNFSIDKATEKLVLKIVDSKTHEVIRQIPAEEVLRRSQHISELLGFLVDENA